MEPIALLVNRLYDTEKKLYQSGRYTHDLFLSEVSIGMGDYLKQLESAEEEALGERDQVDVVDMDFNENEDAYNNEE